MRLKFVTDRHLVSDVQQMVFYLREGKLLPSRYI